MKMLLKYFISLYGVLCLLGTAQAAPMISGEHDEGTTAGVGEIETDYMVFDTIPGNVAGDLADGLTPTVIGTPHDATDPASVLTNGPANGRFLFDDDATGRLVFDLGSVQAVSQVNLFTEHLGGTGGNTTGARGPIRAELWVATGAESGFDFDPALGVDPTTVGYSSIGIGTQVMDPGADTQAGQYGMSFSDTTGTLATARYFLLEFPDLSDVTGRNDRMLTEEIDIIAVPEPASILLMGLALTALLFARRRK